MIDYIRKMIRDEPITFGVMMMMFAILIFGAWDTLHVVKRNAPSQTEVESPATH